jgi:type II secretory pathway pseudopilin PulG
VSRSFGFSLVELLVAMGMALAVLASALSLVRSVQFAFNREGERTDMQQRLRVAHHAIEDGLARAGAGPTRGPRTGALVLSAPPVLPFRQGALADPAGTVSAGTFTVLSVANAAGAQATTRVSMPGRSGAVSIAAGPGCPPGDSACGFAVGMLVVLLSRTGAYDLFTVTSVQGDSLTLQHDMPDSSSIYPPGSAIAEASCSTYFLKPDPSTGAPRLMRYDASGPEITVVEHVVDLSVSYFGEPAPPQAVRISTDPVAVWTTTYGPEPPMPEEPTVSYPLGENCLFQLEPGTRRPLSRLPALGVGVGSTLVELPPSRLSDGPWCPDGVSANRYDADLFRIRRVDVTLRIESAIHWLRGPAGFLFARAGTATVAERWLPDLEVRFSVAPHNLSAGR